MISRSLILIGNQTVTIVSLVSHLWASCTAQSLKSDIYLGYLESFPKKYLPPSFNRCIFSS